MIKCTVWKLYHSQSVRLESLLHRPTTSEIKLSNKDTEVIKIVKKNVKHFTVVTYFDMTDRTFPSK